MVNTCTQKHTLTVHRAEPHHHTQSHTEPYRAIQSHHSILIQIFVMIYCNGNKFSTIFFNDFAFHQEKKQALLWGVCVMVFCSRIGENACESSQHEMFGGWKFGETNSKCYSSMVYVVQACFLLDFAEEHEFLHGNHVFRENYWAEIRLLSNSEHGFWLRNRLFTIFFNFSRISMIFRAFYQFQWFFRKIVKLTTKITAFTDSNWHDRTSLIFPRYSHT